MRQFPRVFLLLGLAALLPSCGGGGSDSGPAANPPASYLLTGTAARGAPIANAALVAKDRNGVSIPGTTSATGMFSLDMAGLQSPFLLQVTPSAGAVLYSVGTQTGIVNITPLTDLVIRNYYRSRGLDVATVFASLTSASPVPTAGEILLLAEMTKSLIAQWLQAQGIDPATFDLMSTPFAANGTGFDAVLDDSSVTDNGVVTNLSVISGTVSQSTSVTASPGTGIIGTSTNTVDSASSVASSSVASSLVPYATNTLAAVNGVNAMLASLRSTINAQGVSLAAADLTGFMDVNLVENGENRAKFAAEMAASFRSTPLLAIEVSQVVSYDDPSKTLVTVIRYLINTGSDIVQEMGPMSFKEIGGLWLFHGNRQLLDVGVLVEHRKEVTSSGTTVTKHVNVDLRFLQGTVNTGTLSIHCPGDTSIFNNTPVPFQGTELKTYQPTANITDNYTEPWDVCYAGAVLASFPPAGTLFEVTLTPTGGSPVTYTVVSRATTTDMITVTTIPAGNALADIFARLDDTLSATWTLPTTFAISRIEASAHCSSTAGQIIVDTPLRLGNAATGASLVVPATVGGQPTTNVSLNVNINGPNGERIIVIYHFQ